MMRAHEKAFDRRSSCEARSSRVCRTSRAVGAILLLVTSMLIAACAKDSITKPSAYLAPCLTARFPSNNVWNQQIGLLPVHPNSQVWVASFFPPTQGFSVATSPGCGLPVLRTGPAWQRMRFDLQAESDDCLYPFSNSQPFETCNPDSHWAAIDTVNCILYEMYDVHTGAPNYAAQGSRWFLNSNDLRPKGWTSADEAGLPISPGLLNYDEAHSGTIRHALRFALSWPDVDTSYVWPARHFGYRDHVQNAIPLGMRMRLKANYVIPPGCSRECAATLTALRDYGAFLADRSGDASGNFSLECQTDPRWGGIPAEIVNVTHGIAAYLEFVDESGCMADPNSGRWKPPF
jgi:hypothetical protein